MSVLIKPDTITVLVPSRDLDEHGWAMNPVLTESGSVTGTVQETKPTADATAEGAGAGPADPQHKRVGTAYLDDPVEPGDVLRTRDTDWRVLTCRFVEDPTGTGRLDSWLASLTELTYGDDDG
jgi:hypothetical protein